MKILAVSDEESAYYYTHYKPGRLADFDLILSCGDLHKSYLEFLVTMARCPLLYVRGNHDDRLISDPPEGCICVEDSVYVHEGVRIAGLGGSYRYRNGKNMYTEREMQGRLLRMMPQIIRNKGIDILMTHAPAHGVNDGDTLSHRGFKTFNRIIERYSPAYMVHGHIHRRYGVNIPHRTEYGSTVIINACGHYVFEYGGEQND